MSSQTPVVPPTAPGRAELTAADVVAGHDLSGRRAVITGGASGIGLETARALVSAGADVIVLDRYAAWVEAATAELGETSGPGSIAGAVVDLTSAPSVDRFVEDLLASGSALDILINNAGVMLPELTLTPAGHEGHFGTHVVGHARLALGVLPALRRADGARVVSVSSWGHMISPVHWDDIHFRAREYEMFAAYGQSKTAVSLFAVAFSERHAGDGVTANSLHPGGIMTSIQELIPMDVQIGMRWRDPSGAKNPDYGFISAEQGAATSVWAAVAPELAGVGGRYLAYCSVAEPWEADGPPPSHAYLPYALDHDAAERLWEIALQAVGEMR